MKSGLLRIAQDVLSLAMCQGIDADERMHRCAYLADGIQLIIDDARICVQRLKQEAVQPTEICALGYRSSSSRDFSASAGAALFWSLSK
jgi:hypothetical protein